MTNGAFSFENNKSVQNPPLTQETANPVVVNDRYQLLEMIGQGAMSRVYKALDRVLDRQVAVKLLREEYGSDENFVARFFREARAVAKLSSPSIVDIYDYGQHQDTYFIVMPYIQGTNLKELIRYERALPVDQAVTIASEVLVGLAAAHSQGIIHRDVKPQNILIRGSDGAAKLTDFGVAYALDGVQITTNGMAIGTAYYMAPEQASGGRLGPYTDLYAVGVVLFEMLSGRLPFLADNQMQIMLQHVNDPPPTLRSIGVPVSPELDAIVQRALAKNPAQRFQNALEMRDALLNIPLTGLIGGYDGIEPGYIPPADAAGRETVTRRPLAEPAGRRTGLLVAALVGVLLLAGLGLAGLLFLTNSNKNPTQTAQAVLPVVTPATETVAPTATSQPTATATSATTTTAAVVPAPDALPTTTPIPPTATAVPPTPTPVPPTATLVPPTATVPPPTLDPGNSGDGDGNGFTPYSLVGAYKRDDGKLYGRPEVALYGAGSGYEQGEIRFQVNGQPRANVFLVITGLDDERRENCNLQVILNGKVVYNGPSAFPNVPTSDNGEGGSDRYWGQVKVAVPANAFKNGTNSLVLRNTTPWTGQLGIPYMLINDLSFAANN